MLLSSAATMVSCGSETKELIGVVTETEYYSFYAKATVSDPKSELSTQQLSDLMLYLGVCGSVNIAGTTDKERPVREYDAWFKKVQEKMMDYVKAHPAVCLTSAGITIETGPTNPIKSTHNFSEFLDK